ncbi:MAG TPA: WG repeat-containing protein [Eubacteriales bacterium]|jgi:hypothetical protein|nr:WG repeat-containing protein [Eubacteriales bacterium]HRU83911.1 WG repeat-containing protein [Eubacteriales bacterium]
MGNNDDRRNKRPRPHRPGNAPAKGQTAERQNNDSQNGAKATQGGRPQSAKPPYQPNRGQPPQRPAPQSQRAPERRAENTTPIAELKLSESTERLLLSNNIKIIGDLLRRTEKDMYRVQNLGKRNLLEIKAALNRIGLDLADTEPQRRQDDMPNKGGVKSAPAKDLKRPAPAPLKEPLPLEEWQKYCRGGKWGFFDGLKVVVPPEYDEVWLFKEGLACVEREEKCGFIDRDNHLVIPCTYDTAMSFSEGLAMIVENNKCGYINKNNELVIPCQFEAATAFEDGKARVKLDGRWGYIYPDGTINWRKTNNN